jgi:23S rRNA pseudoU1915 N3-methylase RlmH
MFCCKKYVEDEIQKFYVDKVTPLVRVEIVTLEEKMKKLVQEEIKKVESKFLTGLSK